MPEFQEPLVEEAFKETFSPWFVEFQEFLEICAISSVKRAPAPKIAELDTKTDPRLSCSLCWWARRSGCLERSGREATRLSSICPWELPESAQHIQHIGKAEGILRFFLFRGLLNALPLEPRLGLPEKIFVRPSCTDYTHRWVQQIRQVEVGAQSVQYAPYCQSVSTKFLSWFLQTLAWSHHIMSYSYSKIHWTNPAAIKWRSVADPYCFQLFKLL